MDGPRRSFWLICCLHMLAIAMHASAATLSPDETSSISGNTNGMGQWVQSPCNESTVKHSDGTCWALKEATGYWHKGPCTDENKINQKSDGSCWSWSDGSPTTSDAPHDWLQVPCAMPTNMTQHHDGTCWAHATGWTQARCDRAGAVAHSDSTCWIVIGDPVETEASADKTESMADRWTMFWESMLGRDNAFPDGPWP
eukprot:jgi/Botrbrau1/9258/Bobra.180_1s0015.1